VINKSNLQSKTLSTVSHTRDSIITRFCTELFLFIWDWNIFRLKRLNIWLLRLITVPEKLPIQTGAWCTLQVFVCTHSFNSSLNGTFKMFRTEETTIAVLQCNKNVILPSFLFKDRLSGLPSVHVSLPYSTFSSKRLAYPDLHTMCLPRDTSPLGYLKLPTDISAIWNCEA
jgi:hypothetical protein